MRSLHGAASTAETRTSIRSPSGPGSDVDSIALWATLADVEDDPTDVDASAERYGVLFGLVEDRR